METAAEASSPGRSSQSRLHSVTARSQLPCAPRICLAAVTDISRRKLWKLPLSTALATRPCRDVRRTELLPPAGGMADVDRIPKIQMLDDRSRVGGVLVHIVAVRHLARASMAPAIDSDDAVSVLEDEQHLHIPAIGAKRPTMMEDDALALAPVLVKIWAPSLVVTVLMLWSPFYPYLKRKDGRETLEAISWAVAFAQAKYGHVKVCRVTGERMP
jgi:hypothetical protein